MLNKLVPLIAFSIFAVAAIGSQQAFAGISEFPVALLEEIFIGTGFATIVYELHNNSDDPFHQPPGPFSIFGFVIEVDPDLESGFIFDPVASIVHDAPDRTTWCVGDSDCSGGGGTPLVLAPDWDAGIVLTPLFGGLSTTDIGPFDQIFTNQDQVAMFYSPGLTELIGPGDTSLDEFSISGPITVASDIVIICLDDTNQIIICDITNPFSPTPIGGDIISLQTTALLLSGAQMTVSWLAPVIISAVGIGLILVRRK